MTAQRFPKYLGLGICGSLLAIALSQSDPRTINAQTVNPDCPLPADVDPSIAATFLNGKCQKVTLRMPQTFYRYYNADNNKFGRYLTTNQYQTNVEAIAQLALNQAWGNKAEKMLSATLPAGTVVYQGIVAPQEPASCYPGGGQQTFIVNSKDSAIQWTDGPDMGIQPFSCP
ncbi:hypothetical protein V0288_17505 [Pannus brasiliensis CCIBt3594]|uniref:Uncharacterized protein n=1 Tax=Pannus brasiliensis CCIBt3594 TaxID=1427578 RepID=A0AAW9QPD4_9CHRO